MLLTCFSYNILLLINHYLKFFVDLILTEEEITKPTTLYEIENFQAKRRSLVKFGSIPFPKGYAFKHLGNNLIYYQYTTNG